MFLDLAWMSGLALAGCARPEPPTPLKPLSDSDIGGTQWLAETEKSLKKSLKGIDPPQRRKTWQVGSEVLYSVRIEGRGPPMVRFVHFILRSTSLDGIKVVRINPGGPADNPEEVLDIHDPGERAGELQVTEWVYDATPQDASAKEPAEQGSAITSGSVAAWLGLYDESGARLAAHYALLPEGHLREGLAEYCEAAAKADFSEGETTASSLELRRWHARAQAALFSFGAVANASPVAQPLMKQILPRSKLLGMWLFGKPKIDFEMGRPTQETRALPALAKNGEAWQLPITISMDGQRTLQCRLTVRRPDSPFDLCAGVLALEGRLIGHPERRFQMHLIAAKRPDGQPTSLKSE